MKINNSVLCLIAVLGLVLAVAFGCSKSKPTEPKNPPATDTTLTLLKTIDFSAYNTSPGPILIEPPNAYIAGENGAVFIVDLSDTLNPHIVGYRAPVEDSVQVPVSGTCPIAKSGNLLIFPTNNAVSRFNPNHMRIFSISGTTITPVGVITSPYYESDHAYVGYQGIFDIWGSKLYADGFIYDVSTPSNPQYVGMTSLYYNAPASSQLGSRAVMLGNHLLFGSFTVDTANHHKLFVIDTVTRTVARTLELPEETGHLNFAVLGARGILWGTSRGGSYLSTRLVTEIDLSSVTNPTLVGTHTLDFRPNQMWFSQTRLAFGGDYDNSTNVGIRICDLSCNILGKNDTLAVNGCAMTTDRVYVSSTGKLLVFRTP